MPQRYSSSSPSVGTRSSPIQNLGGSGRSSKSNFALVAGEVNGRGTCPPKSEVEHATPNRAQATMIGYRVHFMVPFSIEWAVGVNWNRYP